MLLQLLIARPQMIGPILAATPVWVWFLLAGLLWLGIGMLKDKTIGAVRAGIMPIAMTAMSLWGTISAFSHSAASGQVLLAWAIGAALLTVAVGMTRAPTGTRYNPQDRSFTVSGSWLPLALIIGIFLVKYVVGIEVTMNPSLPDDATYSMTCGAIYGVFSGIFAGRSIRLARLAARAPSTVSAPTLTA